MEVNHNYRDGFLSNLDSSRSSDGTTFIPVHLDRVGDVFNLMGSRYTLISGATGSGKTSFADETMILAPYTYIKSQELDKKEDFHWECIYYSLERKEMFKHAKWVSWMIHRDYPDVLLSSDDILGYTSKGPLTEDGYNLVRSYDEEITDLLEHVTISDGKVSAEVIKEMVDARGRELGTLYKTDSGGLVNEHGMRTLTFAEHGIEEKTKVGVKTYINVTHEGTTFKMYKNKHRYFPHKQSTFVFIVIDGINLLGSKDVIDDISVVLSEARDVYGFSPVVVSQQNRTMGDIQRQKLHGSDMSPQIEDVFKSSQMGFDADLILGLFDPSRYKAWDGQGEYKGYKIIPMNDGGNELSMESPAGHNRFRSVHILKNSFGSDGGAYGMKFLGECNTFEVLPVPSDIENLEEVYRRIRNGL